MPKGEKCKTVVFGHNRPSTNNDDGNNIPAKVRVVRIPSDVEKDLEIINQVDQEQQISQNLGGVISERLASAVKNTVHMNQKNLAILKNYMKNLLIPQNCEEICTPKSNREIFCNNIIPVA